MRRLLPVVIATASVLFASPVKGDPGQSSITQYLAALDAAGVHYSSAENAITAGVTTCGALREGMSVQRIMQSARDAGYSVMDAGFIVGDAVVSFCPDQNGKLQRYEDTA